MKLFGRQIMERCLNPRIIILAWIIGGLISAAAYSQAPLQTELKDLDAMLLFTINNELARKSLLESELPKYIVSRGETIYSIGRKYFVSMQTLRELNKVANPELLKEGTALYIPPVDETAAFLCKYRVKAGDSINSLCREYNLEKWQFRRLNPGLAEPLPTSATITLPQALISRESNKLAAFLIKPVRGFLSSRYGFRWGRMHYGVDLAAPYGTPVKAANAGKISFSGWRGGYGLLIIINHGIYNTYYGHLSRILVRRGARVRQGDIIGKVGATGHAYGSHLHFEVERNNIKVNPNNLFKKNN